MTNPRKDIIDQIDQVYKKYNEFRLSFAFPWFEYLKVLKPFDFSSAYLIVKDENEYYELSEELRNVNFVTLEDIGITKISSFTDFTDQFISKFVKIEADHVQPIIFSYDVVNFATHKEVENMCKGFPYYIQEKPAIPVNPVNSPPPTFEAEVERRLSKLEAFYDLCQTPDPRFQVYGLDGYEDSSDRGY